MCTPCGSGSGLVRTDSGVLFSSSVVVVRALLVLVLRPCSFVCWLCCVSSVGSFVGSWPFLCCLSVLGWCVCLLLAWVLGVLGFGLVLVGFVVGFAGFLCKHRDHLTIALPPTEWPGYACSNVRQLYSRAVRVERKKACASTNCWCRRRRRGLTL